MKWTYSYLKQSLNHICSVIYSLSEAKFSNRILISLFFIEKFRLSEIFVQCEAMFSCDMKRNPWPEIYISYILYILERSAHQLSIAKLHIWSEYLLWNYIFCEEKSVSILSGILVRNQLSETTFSIYIIKAKYAIWSGIHSVLGHWDTSQI